jgi:hypothetical protein
LRVTVLLLCAKLLVELNLKSFDHPPISLLRKSKHVYY